MATDTLIADKEEKRLRRNQYIREWRASRPELRERRREYQRKWFAKNREKVAKHDRERYASDSDFRQRKLESCAKMYKKPEYRQRVLARMREQYERCYGDDEESVLLRREKNRRNIKKAIEKGTLLKREAMEQRKSEFLKALDENIGIATTVCIKHGITRDTYYRWLRSDPDFAEKVQAIKDRGVDFAEDMLMSKVVAGDLQAVMFFLRSQGKHRGWNDKVDINVSANTNASITDKVMDNLDDETRNKLVSAYKQARNESLSLPVTSDVIDVKAEKTKLRIDSDN
jgi:hypothetical protein